jgi:acyl-coenzyme A synthetase/AMP-(fatty) acid ligase
MRIWKILLAALPVNADSRALSVAPFSHQITFGAAAPTLLAGARTYVMEDFEPRACLQLIQDEQISRVLGFPYHYMRMAAEDLDAYDLSAMRFWLAGADKVHAAHIAKFIKHGGLRMYPGGPRGSGFCDTYGSTEIGIGGTMQIWLPGSRPEPCVQGRPMPTQFEIRITDKSWNDVASPEQPGRILVRSSTYFGGYWNAHDRWTASRIDDWWWGGDVGKVDRQGRLHFLDREEDSVQTADGTTFTLPIEERLLEHPRVMEAAVYQYDTDERTGLGKAASVVVPVGWLTEDDVRDVSDQARRALASELLEWASVARDHEARQLSAVRVVPLSQLAIGVTGKVLKRTLRECAQATAGELVTRARVPKAAEPAGHEQEQPRA